ncbi:MULTISPECIES: autotransporter family protein [Agrobacterium]|uniref:autotransporter family protein n=1 Tax=Agrobacterium TaxID=357 RepID=UPI00129AB010|nr:MULTISPECIES: autotransporter outer membrane beta-barrel domain-containing protein [Agrobacterium]MCW8281720.1 autotransporter outer membrane beta-barrel domain-containing protein [Agrobacterium sp. InxBP2]MRG65126.1 autotransporter outer membrane beta-barrel domain-containing protein [Agrobacterium pusense]
MCDIRHDTEQLSFSSRREGLSKLSLPLTALALTLPFSATALADCSPLLPSPGDTVVCNGNPAGFTTAGLGALNVQIEQGTNLNGPFTATAMGALAVNSSGNLQSVAITDANSLMFDNRGTINGGLVVNGSGNYTVHNFANSFINSAFSFTGNSVNIVTNDGTLNNGITVNGDGRTTVTNNAGASLNSGIFVTGASQTYVQNYGTIQSTIALGTGDDTIINYDPGQINGSVSQGFGEDVFDMRGGRVSATVNQDDGNDRFLLYGGEVTGSLGAGSGTDSMYWSGGLIGGIDMGTDDDTAYFAGLTDTNLRGIQIDGGFGNDVLTWSNTVGSNPGRLINWERIELTNGSQLTMNNNLTLGDTGTLAGGLVIDGSSYLRAGSGTWSISPAVSGNLAQVQNFGVIDLTSGSNSTSDSLSVIGNYRGFGGQLWINTVLASDDAPSDKLVISSGTTSGATGLVVTNVGGSGAETNQNGILVVEAINGGTTGAGTFNLARRVSAGVYEYQLVRGGVTAGTDNNWYLRNNFLGIDASNPDLPEWLLPGGGDENGEEADGGNGGSGGSGSGGSGGGGGGAGSGSGDGDSVTLIRPEVPILGATPTVVRGLLRVALGTFHERHGEQSWFSDEAGRDIVWTRFFGDHYRQDLSSFADQRYNGKHWGLQFGVPVYRAEHEDGQLDTVGLMAGYARGWGDMRARNIYNRVIEIGDIDVDSYNLGAYWTHTWEDESYVDAVLMHSWLNIDTKSVAGYSANFHGREWTASLETGKKFGVSENWVIEPQAQIYWQYQNFNDANDPGGRIAYDNNSSWTGRIGMRLEGAYTINERPFNPFLLANVWHQFKATDTIRFNETTLRPSWEETSLELGLGFTSKVSENTSVYANASYEFNLGGEDFRAFSGRVGARIVW